jgi:hypothetical protein
MVHSFKLGVLMEKNPLPLPGNPAISIRPMALRPSLATGLALSRGSGCAHLYKNVKGYLQHYEVTFPPKLGRIKPCPLPFLGDALRVGNGVFLVKISLDILAALVGRFNMRGPEKHFCAYLSNAAA